MASGSRPKDEARIESNRKFMIHRDSPAHAAQAAATQSTNAPRMMRLQYAH